MVDQIMLGNLRFDEVDSLVEILRHNGYNPKVEAYDSKVIDPGTGRHRQRYMVGFLSVKGKGD